MISFNSWSNPVKMTGGVLQIRTQRLIVGKWLVQEHAARKWLNQNYCKATYLSNLKWNFIVMPCHVKPPRYLFIYISWPQTVMYTMACHHAILFTLCLRWSNLHFDSLDVFLSVCEIYLVNSPLLSSFQITLFDYSISCCDLDYYDDRARTG